MSEPLVCPWCAKAHPLDERFCSSCGMPLVYSGRQATADDESEAHVRARKIKPQYTRGELVKVGWGRNQSEAEMIQLMLLEEGIPTTVRRSAGFDVPDFLAAGPRDVMAPESGAEVARALLREAGVGPGEPELARIASERRGYPVRLGFGVLVAVAVAATVAWLLLKLVG